MYYCKNCGIEFLHPRKCCETHGFENPPFEEIYLCPSCKSADLGQIRETHCRCCGAKLIQSSKSYCCEDCRLRGEELWEREQKRSGQRSVSPVYALSRELEEYNKAHGTLYSYGQYIALVRGRGGAEDDGK